MNFERDYQRVFILSDAHIHGFETQKDKSALEIFKDRLAWCDLAIAAGHTHKFEIDPIQRYINASEFPYTFVEVSKGQPRLQLNKIYKFWCFSLVAI